MAGSDEVLRALEKAVELSPDSGPLRRHYGETLLNRGLFARSEEQFKAALELDGDDAEAKLGMARALYAQGEAATALLLVRQVTRESRRPARAYILYARLLLGLGSVERAVAEYYRGVEEDPALEDPALAAQLGIRLGRSTRPEAAKAGTSSTTPSATSSTASSATQGPADEVPTFDGDATLAAVPDGDASEDGDASPDEDGEGDGTDTAEIIIPPELLAAAEADRKARQQDSELPPMTEEGEAGERRRSAERYSEALRQLFAVRPRQTFQDVGGMETVKEELQTMILHPLNHRDFYRSYDKPVGGRLLVYGPPGCGKTHLARAIAGEVLAPFLAVGLRDLVDVWQEEAGQVLHKIFDQARQQTPWVLFFDDVDDSSTQYDARPLLQQLLSELDGLNASNDGLLVLVATNAPWRAEPALLREDRFDRVLFLPPPDATDRAEILRILCRGKPQERIDFQHLAGITDGFTGRDLRDLVDEAVERKLEVSLEEGRPNPLGTADLATAAGRVAPSSFLWFDRACRQLNPEPQEGEVYGELRRYLDAHPQA